MRSGGRGEEKKKNNKSSPGIHEDASGEELPPPTPLICHTKPNTTLEKDDNINKWRNINIMPK